MPLDALGPPDVYQPGGYRPPPPAAVYPITDAQPPHHDPAPAASTATGAAVHQGPSAFIRALPAVASAVPLGFGRLWFLHGGHSIAAFGVGGLATVGIGLAFANRTDSEASKLFAAAAGLVLEFAVDAYAPEIYLPLGLAALTLVAAYTAAARVWRRAARAAVTHHERRELRALDAQTTIRVEQIRAERDIAVAGLQATAHVRAVEIQATALTAISAAHSPYPLLELSPLAKAMLERSPDLGLDRPPLEPGRGSEAA